MNLFCDGQKILTDNYKDGYMRTFKGIPSINSVAKKLIRDYIENKQYEKAILYFMAFCEYERDYSEFLVREFIRGNI